MKSVIVKNDRYTVDPLYQWDINQVLEIRGLSLPSVPEIHFANEAMDRSIPRQATTDAFNSAQIVGSATSNIVTAFGVVPAVDIPIIIKAVRL